jgi:hypothetical protein
MESERKGGERSVKLKKKRRSAKKRKGICGD